MQWRKWRDVTTGFTSIIIPEEVSGDLEIIGEFVVSPCTKPPRPKEVFSPKFTHHKSGNLVARVTNGEGHASGYLELRGNSIKSWHFVPNRQV